MNDYMKKVLKVSLYGLKSNKIFIALMFLLSLCLALIWDDMFRGNDYTQVITAAMGVFLPIIMFGYVQKHAECDFYNSMPIKRSQYFFGYLITCFISFLIVYLPAGLIFAPYANPYGSNFFFSGLAVFFVIFAVTVLAVMLSGSLCTTLVTLLILNLIVVEIFSLIFQVTGVDSRVYLDVFQTSIYMFTPFSIIDICYKDNPNLLTVFLTLLMAVVNLVIAFFLHRYRSSENTVALAFPKTRYIIQYIAMFMAALLVSSGTTLYSTNGGERTFNLFVDGALSSLEFIPYSFIAVFFTFILTNMIFENDPRGAFKKIRHFFIFSLGYALFFIFFIGGVLYTNLPYTFVPFDSNLVLVSVYRYEEAGKIKIPDYDEQNEYYYDDDYLATTVIARINGTDENGIPTTSEYPEPTAAEDTITDRGRSDIALITEPPLNYPEDFESYPEDFDVSEIESLPYGQWYSYDQDGYTHYMVQSEDFTVYAITDKEYINYLCDRVKKTHNNRFFIFGYKDIIADCKPWNTGLNWDKYIANDSYMCNILFFGLNDGQYEDYISLMEQDSGNIGYFVSQYDLEPAYSIYSISTYIDSEDAYEEFKSHAAYSEVNVADRETYLYSYFHSNFYSYR